MTLRGIVNGIVSDRTDIDQYLGLVKAGVTGVGTTPLFFDVVNGYGADPTGATSSSTAIEAAQADAAAASSATNKGYVYFPLGNFTITRPIVVNRWDAFVGCAKINNSSQSGTVISYLPNEYSGTANAAVTLSTSTLTDTRATWTTNQWAGYQVCYGDAAAGLNGPYMGTIASNTATVLTLADAGGTTAYYWSPTPAGGPAAQPADGKLYYISKSVFEFATTFSNGTSESVIKGLNIDGGINGLYSTRGAIQVRLSELYFSHQRFAAIYIKGSMQQWFCDHIGGSSPCYGFYCNNEIHPTLGLDVDRFLDKCHFYSFFFHGGTTAIWMKNKTSNNFTWQDVSIDTSKRNAIVLDGGFRALQIEQLSNEGSGIDDTSQPSPIAIWGTVSSGATTVQITNATGVSASSQPITIEGAGGNAGQGFDHYTTITNVTSNQLTINNATTTTITPQAQNTAGTGVTYPTSTTLVDTTASFTALLEGATIFAGVQGSGIKKAVITAVTSATGLTISSWSPAGAPSAGQGYVIGPYEICFAQYCDVKIEKLIAGAGSISIREGVVGASGTSGKLRYAIDASGAASSLMLFDCSTVGRPVYDPLYTTTNYGRLQMRRTSTPWSTAVSLYQRDTGTHTAAPWRSDPGLRLVVSPPGGDLAYLLQDTLLNGTAALGNFEWREGDGSRTVLMTLTSLLAANHGLRLSVPFFPGTYGDAQQTTSSIVAGAGVPSNGSGNDGQFYFRTDGGGAGTTHLYFKVTGAWVAIA